MPVRFPLLLIVAFALVAVVVGCGGGGGQGDLPSYDSGSGSEDAPGSDAEPAPAEADAAPAEAGSVEFEPVEAGSAVSAADDGPNPFAALEGAETAEPTNPFAGLEEDAAEAVEEVVEKVAEPATPAAFASVVSGDWPMWGGDPARNMANTTTGVKLDIDPSTPGEGGLMWKVPLGSQTYGNPVVAGGKVFVGTNNGGEYRDHLTGDAGIVLCFDELTGEFLWQLGREKLPQGRVNDWPEQGICSTPCVEDGVMYVITNRCEVMAIDVEGFRDGENDGVYQEETHTEDVDADILWSVDMIDEYGVFPHNLATSSPVLYEGVLYLLTSNGVDEAHLEVPAPRAPSFLALSAVDGSLVWEAAEPSHLDDEDPGLFDNILHGQWSSPAIAVVDGNAQVLMPGGDGWLYAYETEPDADGFGQVIWKFDLNPKDSKWELGGRGTRNNIVSTPVVYEDSVILAVGQDPEHGEGVGHLYRIDASKTGDVSPTLVDADGNESPNPNSGEIWHYGGEDADGELIYRRTISTVAVADGLCFAPDLSGFVHVIDVATGERKWVYDMFAACWGSPMAVDGRVLIGDEDGELAVLPIDPAPEGLDDELNFEDPIAEIGFDSSIYSTPTIANGRMYVSDRSTLYCFEVK